MTRKVWRVPAEQPSKLDIIPIGPTLQPRASRCYTTDEEIRSSKENANSQAPQNMLAQQRPNKMIKLMHGYAVRLVRSCAT
jgi:hypothetical protein